MRDLRLVLWLRTRHLRGQVVTWASFLGADLDAGSIMERIYAGYAAIIVAIWLLLMAASAASSAADIGARLSEGSATSAASAFGWLPLGLFAIVGVRSLLSAPLKFSFPDIAYVAASGLDARAIVATACATQAATAAATGYCAGYLAGCVAAGAGFASPASGAGFATAMALAAAVVLAWAAGIARVRDAEPGERTWLWVVASIALALAALSPVPGLPGRALAAGLLGSGYAIGAASFGALTVAAAALVAASAAHLDMTAVVEQSALFAELEVFRPLRLYDRTAYADIARRKRLAMRPPGGATLTAGSGRLALLSRALLVHRRRPSTLLWPIVWGAASLPLAAWMTLSPHRLTAYFPAMFLLLAGPAQRLVPVFEADLDRPTLREMLPFGNLELLALDSLPVFAIMTVSAFAVWAVIGSPPEVGATAFALSMLLGICTLLCLGIERFELPMTKRRLGYGITMLVTLAVVLVAGAGGHVDRACVAAAVAAAVLTALAASADRA
jgi:hypothetical protein